MPQLSRRRFFVHSAHQTIGVSAGLAAASWALSPAEAAWAAEPPQPLSVCLVSGSTEYKSHESLAAFQEHVEKKFAVRCTRAFATSDDELPGTENVEHCDVLLLFTRRLTIGGEPLERIKRYCQQSRPLVAVRTASHGLQNWLAMDREVLGGDYHGHYGNQFTPEVEIVPAAKDHPVLAGVKPFRSAGSLYKNPEPAKDITLLLTGKIPEHTEPVAWSRLHAGGRVFYTSLGHPDDFRQESFLRLLVNALYWTTDRNGPGPFVTNFAIPAGSIYRVAS